MSARTIDVGTAKSVLSVRLFAVVVLTCIAANASAQLCTLDTSYPYELNAVRYNIARIADVNSGRMTDSARGVEFTRGLHALYETVSKTDNQNARNYLLGRLYAVRLVADPGTKAVQQRSELKLTGNPVGSHDLFMAMDSAFSALEKANPACIDSTGRYRKGASFIAFNQARAQFEAKQFDSAVVLAQRALIADPGATGPRDLIAAVKKQRDPDPPHKERVPAVAVRSPVAHISHAAETRHNVSQRVYE